LLIVDRRFAIWLLTTTICLWLYMNLQRPVPPPGAPGQAAKAGAEEAKEPAAPLELSPQQWWCLGSMNPADGFNLLVTITNKGGGIERIELTEQKGNKELRYRRTDIQGGYLGYFAPAAVSDGGVSVNCVGRGTPADLAVAKDGSATGLKVGDRILEVAGQQVGDHYALENALQKTQPGQKIIVKVARPTLEPGATSGSDKTDTAEEAASLEGDEKPAAIEAAGAETILEFEATLSEHPLDLIRLARFGGEDQIKENLSHLSCLVTLAQIGEKSIPVGQKELPGVPSQHDSLWLAQTAAANAGPLSEIEFRLPLDQAAEGKSMPIELQRRFKLLPAADVATEGYALDMALEVLNKSDADQSLAYRLEGPNGMSLEGWWCMNKISPNWGGAGARDVIYSLQSSGHDLLGLTAIQKRETKTPEDPEAAIFAATDPVESRRSRYLAVDGQYFTAGYVPGAEAGEFLEFSRASGFLLANQKKVKKSEYRAINLSFAVTSPATKVAPEGKLTAQSMRLFAGPKRPDLLDKFHMAEAIEYGWFPFPAIPLSKILHLFNAIVGNYGLAIVMLTMVVRLCMFPLGRKAAIHAQKMQELAPELKKINEKYKDDLQKRMEAQRDLQRRVGFNPLSGCLPMFIQIPIFIGLYRCLSVDIELRQEPLRHGLSWCSNLAAPDMMYDWQSWMPEFIAGRGSGWLGPYFNLLPMIVVMLFLLQQKMFMPPATDEQTAMTQKVMNFMTVIMGVFFFKVPAGLCLYFITSSLWSIAERKLVKKTIPAGPAMVMAGGDSGPAITVSAKKVTAVNEELAAKKKRRRPPTNR
jgi:YidC/Oxa1 family membrane protein insertase